MSLVVVTGAWGEHRQRYADPFIESFEKHWPEEVRLVIYTDGDLRVRGRAEVRRLDDCMGYTAFMARHRDDPVRWGRQPRAGHQWKDRTLRDGYNFRYDALRFAGQAFAPENVAATMPDGDVLVWLDADVSSRQGIDPKFIEGLLGASQGAYLGRPPKHSEIGFWAIRLDPQTRDFLTTFARLYRTDVVFNLKEWHSAFLWDFARVAFEAKGAVFTNLTPHGHGRVFEVSPLRHHLVHKKGDQKGFR